jgi:hypothetical protein
MVMEIGDSRLGNYVRKGLVLVVGVVLLSFVEPVYADIAPGRGGEGVFNFEGLLIVSFLTLVNATFEVIALYILGLKGRRQLVLAGVANLISWPLMGLTMAMLDFGGFMFQLLLMEVVVIGLETVLIYFLGRKYRLGWLFIRVLLVNVLSATVGTILAYFLLTSLVGLFGFSF